MIKPSTFYAKSGRINIAYQVFGKGLIDLVYVPGWVSNIDYMWSCPELVDFLLELGTFCRVILFDKRGTGLSDRIIEISTLEERMDDIRAVMDAAGSEKAVLLGHSEGGSVSALFAATYPDRTISLITFGAFAKRKYDENYPWGLTESRSNAFYQLIENNWGTKAMNFASFAPSKAKDLKFMEWLENYSRSGASPSAALVLSKMNAEVDITGILEAIHVPTLILQRRGDHYVKVEEGRYLAKYISGARFIELEGTDHLFWSENSESVLEEIREFLFNLSPYCQTQNKLFTLCKLIVFENQDVSDKKEIISNLIYQLVSRYKGSVLEKSGLTYLCIFDGPSKAIHSCIDLLEAPANSPHQMGMCIHIGECMVENHRIVGKQVEILDLMVDQLMANQIIISQTVKNLLSGSGLHFTALSKSTRMDEYGELALFQIKHHLKSMHHRDEDAIFIRSKNDSFLENVLKIIESNLSNEYFGLKNLCDDLGVSERKLQRKLKSITNKSPNQMIRSVRLHRAKELIRGKKLSISEAAYHTGFSNLSYFSKCFKDEFGILPSTINQ